MRKPIALVICAVCASVLLADVAVLEYEIPADEEAEFDLDTLAPHKAVGAVSLPYAAGATLTATAPDGTPSTLVSAASADGAYSWTGAAGGVWTLANSVHGFARIGVAWAVYGDGGTLATGGAAEAYAADSMQSGPNRRIHFHDVLPVAYTGDNWVGDASKAATVTFTPPAGSGLDPTTLNLTGTGTQSFAFQKPGLWTVRLTMSNGMVREATVNISTGMMLIVI